MVKNQPKTVIILGMHRTGTSMTGGLLSRLGVDMGRELLGRKWSNPFGHFEDKNFLELNKRILQTAGGGWDSPPRKETILSQRDKFMGEIKNLTSGRKPKIWGWKDPRTSLTIELYLPCLANPYFLVCRRDPNSITESLKRRNKMEIKVGKRLAEIYEERIDDFFNEHPELQKLDLFYEEITSNPEKWIKKIVDFLEIRVSEKKYREAVKLILPNEKVRKLSKRVKAIQLIKKHIKRPWEIPGFIWKKIKSRLS